jgi:hypothetical protein
MVTVTKLTLTQFYRDFLMVRQSFNPRDFGIGMEKDDFMDRIVELFNQTYSWSVDELVLHPREGPSLLR